MALVENTYDNLSQDNRLDIREAYATLPLGAFDIRAGKQIITWGTGDFLFINDFFPKNYAAFYAGLPIDHLKEGLTALRISGYSSAANLEIVATPFFQENIFPGQDRFILPKDPAGGLAPPLIHPSLRFENGEVAIRLYRNILGWDAGLYGYTGHNRQPTLQILPADTGANLRIAFPQIASGGISLTGSLPLAVINLEAGFSHPFADGAWKAPLLPDQELKFLGGLKAGQTGAWSLGVQYYAELNEFNPNTANMRSGNPFVPENIHQILTSSLDLSPGYQTLRIYCFAYYDLTYRESLVMPEISYQVTDRATIALGGRGYYGNGDPRSFGYYGSNDCVFTRVSYSI